MNRKLISSPPPPPPRFNKKRIIALRLVEYESMKAITECLDKKSHDKHR